MQFKGLSSRKHHAMPDWLTCLMAIAVILLLGMPFPAIALPTSSNGSISITNPEITVYRDPGCRCCGGWMDHLKTQGFDPENVPTADMDAIRQQYAVPQDLGSCHTALIDGYVVEGHVPAADIQRLLAERPNIAGIAVPGMPIGTPGMESEQDRESFTVFSFDKTGNPEVFNQYSF